MERKRRGWGGEAVTGGGVQVGGGREKTERVGWGGSDGGRGAGGGGGWRENGEGGVGRQRWGRCERERKRREEGERWGG